MRHTLALFLAFILTGPAPAQETATDGDPAVEVVPLSPEDNMEPVEGVTPPSLPPLQVFDAADTTLEEHLWVSRPIVIFADTDRDPRFNEQLQLLLARPGPLIERDVVVILDADPDARSDARQRLRPRGFSMVILQRDGRVAIRKPTPWDVRAIIRIIDNLPLRIEEMRNTE
ncbi:DUF4174 domain-containing protein [Alterinioella nitratireducens]|jgi:hypothetical protein|uniref:DUF4174 domain-containing protein n=1 Tax=Alterinioella nitratireducens TaxID=2735915 RepID=UPI001555C447|nr:DUF4174 domain-containing protein [Alterinioella nitratireducens]NPD20489.1 DUF4174 domain-containing protein [Alterinioella nitratireducens]|tara:strand:+ start:177 stop:692 length:516 start_codon:yes stop_codon:yes gene_type:complete